MYNDRERSEPTDMASKPKITVVGTGMVASSLCQWLAVKNIGDIVLASRSEGKAKGKALDLMTAAACFNGKYTIKGTADYADTKDSDVCVITAGLPRKEGMTREDLLVKNKDIIEGITEKLVKHSPNTIIIMVTNPLDVMVYSAYKKSGLPKNKVIGMAGMLDTARFKTFIVEETGKSLDDVEAIVLGSHGDNMVPVIDHCTIDGKPLGEFLSPEKIAAIIERTRKGGYEIIQLMGSSAYFSTGAAIAEMVESIVLDQKRTMPCSCLLEGEYGVDGQFMGVPAVLGKNGVEKIEEFDLQGSEKEAWEESASAIKEMIAKL